MQDEKKMLERMKTNPSTSKLVPLQDKPRGFDKERSSESPSFKVGQSQSPSGGSFPTALGRADSAESGIAEVVDRLNAMVDASRSGSQHLMAGEVLKVLEESGHTIETLSEAIAMLKDERYIIAMAHIKAYQKIAAKKEEIKAFFERLRQPVTIDIPLPQLPEVPNFNYLE